FLSGTGIARRSGFSVIIPLAKKKRNSAGGEASNVSDIDFVVGRLFFSQFFFTCEISFKVAILPKELHLSERPLRLLALETPDKPLQPFVLRGLLSHICFCFQTPQDASA